MMQKMNKEKTDKLVAYIAYAMVLIALAIWVVSYFVRFSSFVGSTAEYRDNAFAGIINAFVNGENPFSYEYFEKSGVTGTLVDNGIIHIFPAVLICKITKLPSLQTLYITNLFYGLIAAWLMYLIIKNTLGSKLLATISSVLSLMYLIRFGMVIGRPDVFALLCQVVIIYLISRKDNDRVWSVSLAALAAVLTLLAKPHYCIIALAYGLYCIFARKYKQFGIYVAFGLFWLALTVVVLYIFFPAHIVISFERYYELFVRVENNQMGINPLAYLFDKWRQVVKQYLPFFGLTVLGIGFSIYKKIKYGEWTAVEQLVFFDMILNALLLFFTGQHTGAGLWYFYFTLLPAINILAIICIDKFSAYRKLYILFVLGASLWTLYRSVRLIPGHEQLENWKGGMAQAREMVEPYMSDTVYLPSVLAGIADEKGIYNFDHGDDIYVPQAESELIEAVPMFKFNETVHNKYYDYYDEIFENTQNKKYSIIVTDSVDIALPKEYSDKFMSLVEENYENIGESMFHTETVHVRLNYWIPKE